MITTEQIVNLPYMYIQGLNLSSSGTKILTLESGQVRDSTNQFDIVIPNEILLNGSVNGVNSVAPGLTLFGNMFYSVFAIGSSLGLQTPAAIISSFGQSPILPKGYDIFNFIGVWNTDGAVNFTKMYQIGGSSKRTYFYDTPISVLSGGSATTFTPVNLSAAIPAIPDISVTLKTDYISTFVNHFFKLRPTGSVSLGEIKITAIVENIEEGNFLIIPGLASSNNPSIDYMANANTDSLSMYVYGFSYN